MAAVPHCRGDAQAGTICDPTLPTFRVSAVRHSSCPAVSFAFLLCGDQLLRGRVLVNILSMRRRAHEDNMNIKAIACSGVFDCNPFLCLMTKVEASFLEFPWRGR